MKILSKQDKIRLIRERDGALCFICKLPFGDDKPTIDHWIPRAAGGSDELSNLRITHKKCNVMKSDTVPRPDGTLPVKPKRIPYYKRRNDRREVLDKFCYDCEGGRKLKENEYCSICGSPPGPPENPRYLKRKSPECDHNIFWCWACSIGIVEKKSAVQNLMTG